MYLIRKDIPIKGVYTNEKWGTCKAKKGLYHKSTIYTNGWGFIITDL